MKKLRVREPVLADPVVQQAIREAARGNAVISRGLGMARSVPTRYAAHAAEWLHAYDKSKEGDHVEFQIRRAR